MIRTIPGVSRSLSFAFVRTRSLVKRDRFVRVRPRTSHSARCRRIFHKKWSSTHKISRDMHIQSSTKTSQYLKVPSSEKNYLQKALSAPRIGAQAAAIFRILFLHRPLRRAPPRPRLVASGRTRFCVAFVYPRDALSVVSPRDSTRTPARKKPSSLKAWWPPARAASPAPRSRASRASPRGARPPSRPPPRPRARAGLDPTPWKVRAETEARPPRRPSLDLRKPFSNRRRARRFATGKQSAFSNSLVSNSPRRDGSHARRFARE